MNNGTRKSTSAPSGSKSRDESSGDELEHLAVPYSKKRVQDIPPRQPKYRIVHRRVRKIEKAFAQGNGINEILVEIAPLPSQAKIDEAIHENGGALPKKLREGIKTVIEIFNKGKNPEERLTRRFLLDEASMAGMKLSATKKGRQPRDFVEDAVLKTITPKSPARTKPSDAPWSDRRADTQVISITCRSGPGS